MNVFEKFQARYDATLEEEYSLQEYLDICRDDPSAYATAAERLLLAIGEPEFIDTSKDPRLSRIFSNKIIKQYPEFSEFYGMEEAVEQIVSFFRHAAQGLEERKQILYLLGPVGGGKSSLAEKLKALMQKVPFYAIKGSPVNESPLGLFDPAEDATILQEDYGIPSRYLRCRMSPWAAKRLKEFGGDISQFRVVKVYPSDPRGPGRHLQNRARATRTTRISPHWSARSTFASSRTTRRTIPDAYSYSGGMCRANQGLHGIRRDVQGTRSRYCTRCSPRPRRATTTAPRAIGGIPFEGVVLAHSNESRSGRHFKHQQEQRGFHRPGIHRQGALLPAGHPRKYGIYREAAADSSSLSETGPVPRTP